MHQDELQHEQVLLAARAFTRLGYLHAFGHISLRLNDGLLITPTRPPFLSQSAADLLACDADGNIRKGDPKARPLEVFLHAQIYRMRGDVNAICRTHAPAASAVQTQGAVPPIRHGFGGIAETVSVFDMTDLIHDPELGARAAQCLGSNDALILRGNGVLTVGTTLGQAAARMWSLEERCNFDRLIPDRNTSFSQQELTARKRWYAAEEERTWNWLRHLGAVHPSRD